MQGVEQPQRERWSACWLAIRRTRLQQREEDECRNFKRYDREQYYTANCTSARSPLQKKGEQTLITWDGVRPFLASLHTCSVTAWAEVLSHEGELLL